MRVLQQSSLLLLLTGLAAALDITSPTGSSLDISEPITIAWTKPDPPAGDFVSVKVEMRLAMKLPANLTTHGPSTTGFDEVIAANLSITSPGSIEWSPSEVVDFLGNFTDYPEELSSARLTFTVSMVGRRWQNGEVPARTDEFTLEGYEGAPPSMGALVRPGWAVLPAAGAAALAWLL